VNRRARRAKTDRLDALKLVRKLMRVGASERGVWSEGACRPSRKKRRATWAQREQEISRTGNARLQAVSIQLA